MGKQARRNRRKASRERGIMSEKKRYIVDPGPQKSGHGIEVTLGWYVAHYVGKHKALNTNGPGIRAATRIEAQFETARPFYELRSEDWAILKEIDNDPGECGYPTLEGRDTQTGKVTRIAIAKRAHSAFMDAIAEAGTEPPEAEEPQPADDADAEEAAQ